MITDAQVHLWEASSAKWPWAEGAKAHLAEPMTAERMLALMDAAGCWAAVRQHWTYPKARSSMWWGGAR